MSSNQFHHGLSNRDHVDSQGFIRETPTNVIGLVAFADDADEQFYPLNTPVLISNINTGLAKSGYHGNLRKSLETIQAIVNPTIVVVRIPSPFVDGTFNASRVIGTTQANGKRTGLQALLTAKTRLGVVPKINIVPDCETPDVINALININKKLRAFSYATPRDENAQMLATKEEVVAYRKTLGDKEVMLIWPEFTAGNVLQSDYASTMSDSTEHSDSTEYGVDVQNMVEFYVDDVLVSGRVTYSTLYADGYRHDKFSVAWNSPKRKFIFNIHDDVKKLKVAPDYTSRVDKSITVNTTTFEVDETVLEGEYILNLEDTITVNITPTAILTKQTGTHHITTSNGFSGAGTLDELAVALRDYLIDVNLDGENMVFTNRNSQLVNISINAQGRSGKNYVAIEQENTSIKLNSKTAEFKLAEVVSVINDSIPSVARLSHGNQIYNLRVSNGYSSKRGFHIGQDDFVKAGIHAYIENGQLVLSNRTPEDIIVDLSTYDAEFIAIEQDNKTVQINAKSVNLTLGAYRGVDFNNQRADALPLLTDITIPDGRYTVSYRINDGEIKTISNNTSEANAQNILANIMYYEGLMREKLVSNGTYSSSDNESRIRPFLVDYQKFLRGADRNHPNFIRHAHFKIEFLITEDVERDFVKLAFGKNTELHSYAIVNWINI